MHAIRFVCLALGLLSLSSSAWAREEPLVRCHRAGASCFRPSDVFFRTDRQWAAHLPARAFLFGAHGKPGRLEEVAYEGSVGKVLGRMKRAPHVFLHVCDAGLPGAKGEEPVAARVARDSGRPVVAAMGSIMGNPARRDDDGARELVKIVVRTDRGLPELVAEAEAWRVFYPDGRSKPLRADRYFRKVVPPTKAGAPR